MSEQWSSFANPGGAAGVPSELAGQVAGRRGLLRGVVRSLPQAREAAQKVFVEAWRKAGSYDPDEGAVVTAARLDVRPGTVTSALRDGLRRLCHAQTRATSTRPAPLPAARSGSQTARVPGVGPRADPGQGTAPA